LHNKQFYICFTEIAEKRERGGIATFDYDFTSALLDYFGQQCYSYTIIDNKAYTLCNDISGKMAGLVCNNELKIRYNDIYCMDYSMNDDFIIIVGGALNFNDTNQSGGIVLKFDRNFRPIAEPVLLRGGGQFMGCRFTAYDLTDNLYSEDTSDLDLTPRTAEKVRIRDLTEFDLQVNQR
jgi:hypothetical protein